MGLGWKKRERRVDSQPFGRQIERILRNTVVESLMGFHRLRFSAVWLPEEVFCGGSSCRDVSKAGMVD